MNTTFYSIRSLPNHWLAPLRSLLVMLLLALSACGGGVETGGTGAYVQGPVSGFGSIIVAGVHFDDGCAACIEDADGGSLDRSQLRLGMMVEIDSGPIRNDGSGRIATATRVRVGSQLLGEITALDLPNARLDVLGQAVRLTPATVIDGVAGGAAALALGNVVEVHGFFAATSDELAEGYVTTRVELRSAAPPRYHVQGIVRDLQAQPPTLRIGTQWFDLPASGVPPGLDDGQFVRLTLLTAPNSAGRWPVERVVLRQIRPDDREEAELEGLITSFGSAAQFSVNGLPVQAGASTQFVDGPVGLGMRVEVQGRTQGGVLLASTVAIKSDAEAYNEGVDIRDLVTSVDPVAQTLVLHGITVSYGSAVFEKGSAADLEPGISRVRVRGTLSSDRTQVVATRIEFLD
jgi:hypothetical protein